METNKDQFARLKENASQRFARYQQQVSTTSEETEQSEPIERESRHIRLDPDIRAQMNVASAMSTDGSTTDEREFEIHYKVLDPIHFFQRKADDLTRRPGQNDGQFRAYQQRMAKMWTEQFIKTHPEHGKGRIDRLSTHRKRKHKPKEKQMASKSKGKRYTAGLRRRILRMADKRGISHAAKHYDVSSTTIHKWRTSSGAVKARKSKGVKVSMKRGSSLSVIRDLAQKLLVAVDKHRAEMASILSR